MGERVDRTVFWLFTLSFPAVWYSLPCALSRRCFFCIISLIRLHFLWFLVCAIAFALSGFNAYLYIQASRCSPPSILSAPDGNQSVSLLNYIPENVKTNAMKSDLRGLLMSSSFRSAFVNAVGSAAANLVSSPCSTNSANIT